MNTILDSNRLFSNETTLKEIYKLTKLYPTFITSEGILDPTDDISLVDATLASMCMMGVFDSHIVSEVEYKDVLLHDIFPTHIETKINIGDTLFITNYSKHLQRPIISIFDSVERRLSEQYFERLLSVIKKSEHNVLLVNSPFSKETLTPYEVSKRFENGETHARMFINKEQTIGYMDVILLNIRTQS